MSIVRTEILTEKTLLTLAKTLKFDGRGRSRPHASVLEIDDVKSELSLLALKLEDKLEDIFKKDGIKGVTSYLYSACVSVLMKENVRFSSPVSIGEAARERDPKHIQDAKKSAMKPIYDSEDEMHMIEGGSSDNPLNQLLRLEEEGMIGLVAQNCPVFYSTLPDSPSNNACALPTDIRCVVIQNELFKFCTSPLIGMTKSEAYKIAKQARELYEKRQIKWVS